MLNRLLLVVAVMALAFLASRLPAADPVVIAGAVP